MVYEITYESNTRTTRGPFVQKCDGKAFAREFVQRQRQYGSNEIVKIEKVSAKGVRTEVFDL